MQKTIQKWCHRTRLVQWHHFCIVFFAFFYRDSVQVIDVFTQARACSVRRAMSIITAVLQHVPSNGRSPLPLGYHCIKNEKKFVVRRDAINSPSGVCNFIPVSSRVVHKRLLCATRKWDVWVATADLVIRITTVMSHSPPAYVLEFSYAHIQLVHTLISTFLSWHS